MSSIIHWLSPWWLSPPVTRDTGVRFPPGRYFLFLQEIRKIPIFNQRCVIVQIVLEMIERGLFKKAPIGIEPTTSILGGRYPYFYLVVFVASCGVSSILLSLTYCNDRRCGVIFFCFDRGSLWHSWHRFCKSRQVIPTQFNLQPVGEYALKLYFFSGLVHPVFCIYYFTYLFEFDKINEFS